MVKAFPRSNTAVVPYFVQVMFGSGFPVALQCSTTSSYSKTVLFDGARSISVGPGNKIINKPQSVLV